MTIKDRVIGIRIDEKLAKELDLANALLSRNSSETIRYLLKMGIISYKLLTSDRTSTDIELETIIDNLRPERKERLLELLIEELQPHEVERIRQKKANKLLQGRAQSEEEPSNANLSDLPPAWKLWDDLDFHHQSIDNLSLIYRTSLENQRKVREYLARLKTQKDQVSREQHELERQERFLNGSNTNMVGRPDPQIPL